MTVPCSCLTDRSLNLIADELEESKYLRYELAEYKNFADYIKVKAWYNDSTLVYSGLAGALILGAVIGASLNHNLK